MMYVECSAPWDQVIAAIKEEATKAEVVNLGDPSKGKFAYTSKKCHTRENVEVLRRSEAYLDAFWDLFDQLVIEKAGKVCGTALTHFISKPRMLQRTPEWVETEKLPFQSSGQKEVIDDVDLYFLHQSASLINNNNTQGKVLNVPLPKSKVKTRGISSTLEEPVFTDQADEAIIQPSPPYPQPSFVVDTRAFKVFSTIFNQPTKLAPVELHWNDFLHAMTSIGFSAIKLEGSIWKFQPINHGVERNIKFHEPHSSKVLSKIARRFGRRLNRVYRWCSETFSPTEK
ncbi:hypothetical protein N7540_006860 [Penicillium herquei]|nr:hypothetical protein N7540_006860 [Penicillium herquei]